MKKMSKIQNSNDKTVKVPGLDKTKFGLFQSKFKSVAAIKSFTKALEPAFASKLPAKESDVLKSSGKDKQKQKNKTVNLVAVYYLTLSALEQEQQLNFINDARADDQPSELACEVWKNIKNKFLPSDVLVETELSKKLIGLALPKREYPKKLGKQNAIIQSRYKIQVEEKEQISAVVNA